MQREKSGQLLICQLDMKDTHTHTPRKEAYMSTDICSLSNRFELKLHGGVKGLKE